jgi:DHA1 family tetracycline resistance protein-like MFS transporter
MTENQFTFGRVAPIFFLVLVDVLGLSIILPLLHLYAARFNASPLEIGLVVASFPLAQLVGVPMMGALSDRFGRKPLLLISQVTTCASFILLGAANTLWLVVASRVLDGTFGANLSTAQAALSDISDEKNRSRALGLTGAAFGVGFVLGPIISVISLNFSDSLAIPAYIAAAYSALSIFLTLFLFKETLDPENRSESTRKAVSPVKAIQMLKDGRVRLLLVMMFAQQLIFFGFESLIGVFTLSRLGLLGQGTAYVFLFTGVILVIVQGYFIGKWTDKYGEARVVQVALTLLAVGLLWLAFTPQQPPYNYIRPRAERALLEQQQAGEVALQIDLPETDQRGPWGVPWLLIGIIPLSIGAGLIRPSINSLLTQRVTEREYGVILGVSTAFVSAANAIAPIIGGWLFGAVSSTAPFLFGGIIMALLAGVSYRTVTDGREREPTPREQPVLE